MTEDERESDEILDELRDMLDVEDLESTEPQEAFSLWIQQLDRADSTMQSYRYRVTPFLEFLENRGIGDLAELKTRHIKEFEARRRAGNLQLQTLNNQFGTIRQFLQYCRELNAVSEDVVAAIDVPNLSKEDRVNTEKLITNRAEEILDNLNRYQYASRKHVLFLLLWHTPARVGTIHSLDLEDVYLDDSDLDRIRKQLSQEFVPSVVEEVLSKADPPFLLPRHHPETETPLKNGEDGERVINLFDEVGEVLDGYIRVNRDDVKDDYGKKPLLTSQRGDGRLSVPAMRNWIYILTQPCEFGGPCPHDRDPETCEAREHGHGSKCPSSKSPHKLRTGSITMHRDRGWPPSALAERANTSEELIEGVYDQPQKLIRGSSRREFLDKLKETDHDSDNDTTANSDE